MRLFEQFAEESPAAACARPTPSLVGIAKLAAGSELLESKRRVEYRELETRSFIGRCSNPKMLFQWTINPYRGCEYGCKYCYARYTHEFMELRDGEDFETRIFAKRFDRARFARELRALPDGAAIGLGTATDPYQPAERRYGITRAMLEEFAKWRGLRLLITTKSDLVARDADLLAEIGTRHDLGVTLTVTTVDADLARLLEPFAPRPELRLEAVSRLAEKGIRVRVFASPVLPLINDGDQGLEAVAQAARAAGAIWFGGNLLFLQPCAKKVFMPFLEEKMPRLYAKYRRAFSGTANLPASYGEELQERIRAIRARTGLTSRSGEPVDPNAELDFDSQAEKGNLGWGTAPIQRQLDLGL